MLNLIRPIIAFFLISNLYFISLFANQSAKDSTVMGYTKYILGITSDDADIILADGYTIDTTENHIAHNYIFNILKCNTFDSSVIIKSCYNLKKRSLRISFSDDLTKMCFDIDSIGNILMYTGKMKMGVTAFFLNYEYCRDSVIKIEYIQDCCSPKLRRKCQNSDTLLPDMTDFEKDPSFDVLYRIEPFNPIIINPKKIRFAFYFRRTGELQMVEEQFLE